MDKKLRYKNKHRLGNKAASFIVAVLFLLGNIVLPTTARANLGTVGPINGESGFPQWYQDGNGLALELCLDQLFCLFDPVEEGNLFSEEIEFGPEAFWWSSEAGIDIAPSGALTTGGKALLVQALEAAFANENPTDGDQISFSRLRIRIDVPVAGFYIITHPFNVEVFEVTEQRMIDTGGIRAIDADKVDGVTLKHFSGSFGKIGDIGCKTTPCDFGLALDGAIGPFLKWTGDNFITDPVTGNKYIGDPNIPHEVTGSPFGTNFFRVEGPPGSNLDGLGNDFVETSLFDTQGKLADTTPPNFGDRRAEPPVIDANGTQFTSLIVNISDDISGIDRVIVDLSPIGNLDNTEMFLFSGDRFNGEFIASFPTTFEGEYSFNVTAFDKSGNSAVTTVDLQVVVPIPPIITILGENPANVLLNSDYIDAGATAFDEVEGDITEFIFVNNTVNTGLVGSYSVTYTIFDISGNIAEAQRVVNVLGEDIVPPVVFFFGDDPLTIQKDSFFDPREGVFAEDNFDGDITDQIQIDNPVNTAFPGEYTVTYSVIDSSGNQSVFLPRRIIVLNNLPEQEVREEPVITILGNNPETITVGSEYIDAGATAFDEQDGDLTNQILVESDLDINTPGEYFVVYSVFDSDGNFTVEGRIVNVLTADTTPPVITILGNNPETITVGSEYIDAGATAFDEQDGDLTSQIVTDNPVNTSFSGLYEVSYTATDNTGNSSQAVRTVEVFSPQEFNHSISLLVPNEWTIFSSPKKSSSVRMIENDIEAILYYDSFSKQFVQITDLADERLLNPLNAFYIKPIRQTAIFFSEAPVEGPEIIQKELNEEWNLVGVNNDGLAKNEFSQLQITPVRGGMTTLYVPQIFNSRKNIFTDWEADANKDLNANPIIDLPLRETDPFDGYWIFLDSVLTYSKQRS